MTYHPPVLIFVDTAFNVVLGAGLTGLDHTTEFALTDNWTSDAHCERDS